MEEDMEEDVGVFIPNMLEAALGRFGARYEGLLSIEVVLPATYPPLSYSIDPKLGLNPVLPMAVGGLLIVVAPYLLDVDGIRLPPIPGFSFNCLFSQVII